MDFKATPEYGDPTTGNITYSEGVFIYDVNSFSITEEMIVEGKMTEKFCDICPLNFKVYRESLTGATQAEKDAKWRDLAAERTSIRMWSDIEQDYVYGGRISAANELMDGSGKVYKAITCESELAYLTDITISLADVYAEEGYSFATTDNLFIGDIMGLVTDIITIYNRKAGGFAGNISKRFNLQFANYNPNGDYPYSIMFYRSPYVPSGSGITGNMLHKDSEIDTMTAWAWIQWICVRYGLSVSVKHNMNYGTDSDNYLILYLEGLENSNKQYGYKASPKIQLRDNMQSLKVTHNFSGSGRVTHIVPLGGIGADGTRLDVYSIPQYNPITHEVFNSRAVPNYQLAVTYGAVERIEIHNDLVDDGNRTAAEVEAMKTTLLSRGMESAMKLNDKITAVQVGALDLAEAGVNVDAFKVGYYYDIVNEMFNYLSGGSTVAFNKTYQLFAKETPLKYPWQASFSFGTENREISAKKNVDKQESLKQQIFSTGGIIASRLDNAAIKLCSTQAEYNSFGAHRAETLYTVPQSNGETWLYKGDERIVISGGGGGDSFTIDYASVLSAEQSVTYTTGQTIAIAAQCGMTALYGGSPSRGVCNGYRVLFNVPYADITQQDVSSYFVLNTGGSGQYAIYRVRFYSQTVSAFTLRLFATQYNADGTVASSETRDYDYSYSGDLSGLTFGATADYSTITEGSSSQQAAGVYGQYSGKGDGLSGNMNIVIKAWLDGVALTPTSRNTSTVFSNTCNIKSLAEYHFDVSLNKRYEPSGGV